MKYSIEVKYGGVVKSVELPIPFHFAALGRCLQNVFKCKQKEVFGLRYPSTSTIYPLYAFQCAEDVIAISEKNIEPVYMVFHNNLSDYTNKEIKLDSDKFYGFLEKMGIKDILSLKQFDSLLATMFGTVNTSIAFRELNKSIEEMNKGVSRSDLWEYISSYISKPFNERIRILFDYFDENGDCVLDYPEIEKFFTSLFIQEIAFYMTGEIGCANKEYLKLFGMQCTKRLITDYGSIGRDYSYDVLFFWIMNHAYLLFPSSFYDAPTKEIEEACVYEEWKEEKECNYETVYYLACLYKELCDASVSTALIEEMKDAANQDGTIDDSVFDAVVHKVICKENEKDMNTVSTICDCFKAILHDKEDDSSLNWKEVIILFTILDTIVFCNVSSSMAFLNMALEDTEDHLYSEATIRSLFHCMIRSMTNTKRNTKDLSDNNVYVNTNATIKGKQNRITMYLYCCFKQFVNSLVCKSDEGGNKEKSRSIDPTAIDECYVNQLLFQCLNHYLIGSSLMRLVVSLKDFFTISLEGKKQMKKREMDILPIVPSIQSSASLQESGDISRLRIENEIYASEVIDLNESTEVEAVADKIGIVRQGIGLSLVEESPLFDVDFEELGLATYSGDPLRTSISVYNTMTSAGIAFQKDSGNHVDVFTKDTNLGIFIRYMTRKWSSLFDMATLTVDTLLVAFSKYDNYSGDEDNMFITEYFSFINDIYSILHVAVPKISGSIIKLFYKLDHRNTCRINRYELLSILSLFCRDIYAQDNMDILWTIISRTDCTPQGLSTFSVYIQGVYSLIDIMLPTLISNTGHQIQPLVLSVSDYLYSSCVHSSEELTQQLDSGSPYITEDVFKAWASSSFYLDLFIREGRAIYNRHVYEMQRLLGLTNTRIKDMIEIVSLYADEDGFLTKERFEMMMRDNYPMSVCDVDVHKRYDMIQDIGLLLSKDNKIHSKVLVCALSIIMNEEREVLWNGILGFVSISSDSQGITQADSVMVFKSLITMSLYVQVGVFDPSFVKCYEDYISSTLSELVFPAPPSDLLPLLYDAMNMVLPVSVTQHLLDQPSVSYTAMMNLRNLAGLGNILYTTVSSKIAEFEDDTITKGGYYDLVAFIVSGKSLTPSYVEDIYNRIYSAVQKVSPNVLGVSKEALLYAFSALYPNNSAAIDIIYSCMEKEEGVVSYETLVLYLEYVYSVIYEFFECFDMSVVTISQIASSIADDCFSYGNCSCSSGLTLSIFRNWVRECGYIRLSQNEEKVPHYSPYILQENTKEVKYDVLMAPLLEVENPKKMYEKQQKEKQELQIYIDNISSFATKMYYRSIDDSMIELINKQSDSDGQVYRNSIISILSLEIMQAYKVEVNEERSLLLQQSVELTKEIRAIRRGLTILFDNLDYAQSGSLSVSCLIAILGVLSEGDIRDRLCKMIEVGCKVVGDIVYTSSVLSVLQVFYPFLDMLLPSIFTSMHTNALQQAFIMQKAIEECGDDGICDVSTVVSMLYDQMLSFTGRLRTIAMGEKTQDIAIEEVMRQISFPIGLATDIKAVLLTQLPEAAPTCLCESYILQNKKMKGLLHERLNPVLIRDMLRQWMNGFATPLGPLQLEKLIVSILKLFGDKTGSVLYDDIVYAFFTLFSFKDNSIVSILHHLYDCIRLIVDREVLTFQNIRYALNIMVKMYLWMVQKEGFLSTELVSTKLRQLLELSQASNDETTVSKDSFVGSFFIQYYAPSDLNMQRFISIVLHASNEKMPTPWEGDMP